MNLLNMAPDRSLGVLADFADRNGLDSYRTDQIHRWLWRRPVDSWSDATNIPAGTAEILNAEFALPRLELVSRQESSDGTTKFLWGLHDGERVESVLIPEGRRRTLCISSQVGCAFGCVFCATGTMGLIRNLDPWEIAGQVRELLVQGAARPSNIVFMGMGEPLHNWESVDTALSIFNARLGFGIGARSITVSTVGLVPRLADLAARPEQFGLAISLHAPTTAKRRRLLPVERKYPIPDLLKALQQFKRRVTFEYVMIDGVNDLDEDARDLAEIARPLGAMVNLIPLHPGGAADYSGSSTSRRRDFAKILTSFGVKAIVRRSRGLDIAAACGQLRVSLERDGHIGAE